MITIKVKRARYSVTQGEAKIYINGEKIIGFNDEIYLKQKDGTFTNGFDTVKDVKHYGEIIEGWGSIKPDSDFIKGLLYHPYDNIYKHSDKFKEAIEKYD